MISILTGTVLVQTNFNSLRFSLTRLSSKLCWIHDSCFLFSSSFTITIFLCPLTPSTVDFKIIKKIYRNYLQIAKILARNLGHIGMVLFFTWTFLNIAIDSNTEYFAFTVTLIFKSWCSGFSLKSTSTWMWTFFHCPFSPREIDLNVKKEKTMFFIPNHEFKVKVSMIIEFCRYNGIRLYIKYVENYNRSQTFILSFVF